MGTLSNIEIASSTSYFTALFVTGGVAYDVVFTRHDEKNIGCESKEVVNVQQGDEDVIDDALWKEIEKHLCMIEEPDSSDALQFTIEVSKDWLDVLRFLIRRILSGSSGTPEEALEATIFRQMKEQLNS